MMNSKKYAKEYANVECHLEMFSLVEEIKETIYKLNTEGYLSDKQYNIIEEEINCIYKRYKMTKTDILDKIRAEIDEQIKYNTYFNSDMAKGEIIAFEWVKRKIDEYGKEQK